MIYVLEKPAQGEASAWFAFDDDDFCTKVAEADALQPWEIYDVVTPRELLEMTGGTPESVEAREKFPAICQLGDTSGWDTPLYRADHLLGRGVYQPQAVSEREAHLAALRQRLPSFRVYWNESEALAAFESGEAAFAELGGWRARFALREQLVALEVLAEDL